ncbi:hypothetical protein SAMN05443639_11656 [Stigmatella erecta]|uniref:Uncharacterized protein n=1 Tax=Stigmatella erecta TaxID=83460 RepID=A0A1I0KY88_9BACT|nr:hypothetical protein SAMN05443639_11656 [Stigmatella erecta]
MGRWCASASPSACAKKARVAWNCPGKRRPRARADWCAVAVTVGARVRATRTLQRIAPPASFARIPLPNRCACPTAGCKGAPWARTASGSMREPRYARECMGRNVSNRPVRKAASAKCASSPRFQEKCGWSALSDAVRDSPPVRRGRFATAGNANPLAIPRTLTPAVTVIVAESADPTVSMRASQTGSAWRLFTDTKPSFISPVALFHPAGALPSGSCVARREIPSSTGPGIDLPRAHLLQSSGCRRLFERLGHLRSRRKAGQFPGVRVQWHRDTLCDPREAIAGRVGRLKRRRASS